jgi:hypothetical protein
MSEQTTISVRIDNDVAITIDQVCDMMRIRKSDFLRACLYKLCSTPNSKGELDKFLQEIGFVKKETWSLKK